jgi:hypothetical protein
VELYDEDAPTTPVTGLTNKKKLKILKVVMSEALSSGDSVEFFDGNVSLGKVTLDAPVALGAKVTLTLGTALSGDSLHSLTAKVTIASGEKAGTSTASTPLTFTLDTEAPNKPLIDSVVDGVRGADNAWHTKLTKPDLQVSGLEGKGSVVRLYASDDLDSPLGSALLLSGTTLKVTLGSSLSEGEHSIVATEVDKAGNESVASVVLVINVDLTRPEKPVIVLYGEPSANPIFRMDKLERDAYVTLYERIEGGADKRIMGQTAGGTREQFIPEDPFSVGVHTVYVKVEDVAGNESVPSDDLSFTVPASSEWVEGVGLGTMSDADYGF